jgi:hypothetical protein
MPTPMTATMVLGPLSTRRRRLSLTACCRLSTVLPAAGMPHSTCSSRRSGTARRPPSDMEWEACNGALELRKRTAGGVL